jgi:hypothetical protein
MRCLRGDHLATRNPHNESRTMKRSRKNEEIAVIKLWSRFGRESAPTPNATTAAATKPLFVAVVIRSHSGLVLPNGKDEP